jgi:hypothetical protein
MPVLVIAIDQGEELFLAEGQEEARPFLTLLRDLLMTDAPAVIAVLTIRCKSRQSSPVSRKTCSVCRRCRRDPTPR